MITLREQSRGVFSSFMFLQGRLAMPSSRRGDWEHATLLSVQGSVVTSARKKEENDSMKTVWSFFNGGCHPVQKWLKDRKTRTLTADDIFHYKSTVIALMETSSLMSNLSAMADEWMTLSLNHNETVFGETDAQSLPN